MRILTSLSLLATCYVCVTTSAPTESLFPLSHTTATATPPPSSSSSSSPSPRREPWWNTIFSSAKPHPLVIWHGLGDSSYSEGMLDLKASLQTSFPGIFVHLVSLGQDETSDRNRGVFGQVDMDVEAVCKQIAEMPELKDGFDAVGFSQGGQFLRALVQRCPEANVRNLVTFGSQHMGISDFPACRTGDLLCRLTEVALRSGIYTDYAQSHVVTAQYYRNPLDLNSFQRYLQSNHFLTDINNEVERPKEVYRQRLQALDTFVMLQFDEDTTVIPKRSSWFESYAIASNVSVSITVSDLQDVQVETIPLRQSDLYLQDRLGLKVLDQRGALVLDVCKGAHMQIDSACQEKIFGRYIGIPQSTFSHLLPRSIRHTWHAILFRIAAVEGPTTWPWTAHLLVLLVTYALLRVMVTLGIYMGTRAQRALEERRARKEGSIRLP